MSYIYKVLADTPVGLWSLDSTASSQLTDSTGNGYTGTVVSGLADDRPIVARGVKGQLLSGSGFTLPITGLMASGAQSKAFAYEFWMRPTSVAAGSMSLFKRTTSGITVSGNTITLSLSMSTTVTLSWSGFKVGEIYHVIVQYDGTSAAMYVNGSLVGTAEITQTNYDSSFTDTASTLSFSATGGFTSTLDSIAVYNHLLTEPQIAAHYSYGIDYPEAVKISGMSDSHQFRIYGGNATIFGQVYADEDADWALGTFTGAATYKDDVLLNQYSDTSSQYEAGTWLASYSIEAQAVTLAGSRITWDANITNLTVEVSTNGGTSFSTATNGSSPIGAASLSSGMDIVIRVTFAAGATQTQVTRLNLTLYTAKDITGTNGDIPIVVSDPTNAVLSEYDYEPASFNANLGVTLSSSTNRLSVATDPAFGGYRAMEFFIKFSTSTASKTVMTSSVGSPPTISTNGTGQWTFTNLTALYVDGVSISSGTTISAGVWHHVVAVFASAAGTFYFGNNAAQNSAYPCQIGYLATYFTVPSAATVLAMYNALVGTSPVRVTDSQTVTVAEQILAGGVPVRAYAYNWSVSGAG
jgi:hypothetical protein